jgi:hypothetical protein
MKVIYEYPMHLLKIKGLLNQLEAPLSSNFTFYIPKPLALQKLSA